MALVKETVIDRIEVLEGGVIQVRRATYIVEDGKRLGNAIMLEREVYEPGVADERMAKEHKRVQDIAALEWTPDVIIAALEREEQRALAQAARDEAIAAARELERQRTDPVQ